MRRATREVLRECERLGPVVEADSTIVDLDRRAVPLHVELSDVVESDFVGSLGGNLPMECRWSEEKRV